MTKKQTGQRKFLTDGYKAPVSKPPQTTVTKGYSAPSGAKLVGTPPSTGSAVTQTKKPKS